MGPRCHRQVRNERVTVLQRQRVSFCRRIVLESRRSALSDGELPASDGRPFAWRHEQFKRARADRCAMCKRHSSALRLGRPRDGDDSVAPACARPSARTFSFAITAPANSELSSRMIDHRQSSAAIVHHCRNNLAFRWAAVVGNRDDSRLFIGQFRKRFPFAAHGRRAQSHTAHAGTAAARSRIERVTIRVVYRRVLGIGHTA